MNIMKKVKSIQNETFEVIRTSTRKPYSAVKAKSDGCRIIYDALPLIISDNGFVSINILLPSRNLIVGKVFVIVGEHINMDIAAPYIYVFQNIKGLHRSIFGKTDYNLFAGGKKISISFMWMGKYTGWILISKRMIVEYGYNPSSEDLNDSGIDELTYDNDSTK